MLPLKKILGSLNETNDLAKPQEDKKTPKNTNTKNKPKQNFGTWTEIPGISSQAEWLAFVVTSNI